MFQSFVLQSIDRVDIMHICHYAGESVIFCYYMGCVHLCRVAGNTVRSHMASDISWLWDGVLL